LKLETLAIVNKNPFVVDPYFKKQFSVKIELPRLLNPSFQYYCELESIKENTVKLDRWLNCSLNVTSMNLMKTISFWLNDTIEHETLRLHEFNVSFSSLHLQPSSRKFDSTDTLEIFDNTRTLIIPEEFRNLGYKLVSNNSFASNCLFQFGSTVCTGLSIERNLDLMRFNLFLQWNLTQNFTNLVPIRQTYILYEEKKIEFPSQQNIMYYTSNFIPNLNFTLSMKLEYYENIYVKMFNFKTGFESKLPLKYNSYNSSFISFSIDNFTSSSAGKKSLQLWYQDSSYLPYELKISENALDLYFLTVGRVLSFKPAAIVYNKTMNMFISSTFDVSSVLDGNYSCKYGNEQKNYTSKAVISLTGEFNCPIIWSETLGSISLSIYFTVNEELKLVVPAEKITVVCKNFHNLSSFSFQLFSTILWNNRRK
jgi:hypothetical protein